MTEENNCGQAHHGLGEPYEPVEYGKPKKPELTIEYHNTRVKLHTARFELNGSEKSKDPEGVRYVPHGWKKKEDERME